MVLDAAALVAGLIVLPLLLLGIVALSAGALQRHEKRPVFAWLWPESRDQSRYAACVVGAVVAGVVCLVLLLLFESRSMLLIAGVIGPIVGVVGSWRLGTSRGHPSRMRRVFECCAERLDTRLGRLLQERHSPDDPEATN